MAILGRCAATLIGLFSIAFSLIAHAAEDLTPYFIEASAFVAAVTREDVPPVSVRRGHQLELQNAVFGSPPSQPLHRPQVAAAFNPVRGEIVIGDDIDLMTPLGLSFLVHELVHSQQYAAGRHIHATCHGTLEAEAYAIQARFLRARQQPREAVLFDILGLLQVDCGGHLR